VLTPLRAHSTHDASLSAQHVDSHWLGTGNTNSSLSAHSTLYSLSLRAQLTPLILSRVVHVTPSHSGLESLSLSCQGPHTDSTLKFTQGSSRVTAIAPTVHHPSSLSLSAGLT